MTFDYKENPLAWDINSAIKQDPSILEEYKRKQFEIDYLYHAVFSTEAGEKLLNMLVENILLKSTWAPNASYDKAIATGFAREGQNTIIRAFKDGVDKIKQAPTLEQYAKL